MGVRIKDGILQQRSWVTWPDGTRVAEGKSEFSDKSIGETILQAWDKAIGEFVQTHGRFPETERLLIRGAATSREVILEIGEVT